MVKSGTRLRYGASGTDGQDEVDVRFITMVFGSLILAAATQGTSLMLFTMVLRADLFRYRCRWCVASQRQWLDD